MTLRRCKVLKVSPELFVEFLKTPRDQTVRYSVIYPLPDDARILAVYRVEPYSLAGPETATVSIILESETWPEVDVHGVESVPEIENVPIITIHSSESVG